MSRQKYHLVEVSSGFAVFLCRGRVKLTSDRELATRFSARQAQRWRSHHPHILYAPVAIIEESEVAS